MQKQHNSANENEKKNQTSRKFIMEAKELEKSLWSLENGNILRLKEQSNYIQLLDEKVKSLLLGWSRCVQ